MATIIYKCFMTKILFYLTALCLKFCYCYKFHLAKLNYLKGTVQRDLRGSNVTSFDRFRFKDVPLGLLF